jgi:hypothetical protein
MTFGRLRLKARQSSLTQAKLVILTAQTSANPVEGAPQPRELFHAFPRIREALFAAIGALGLARRLYVRDPGRGKRLVEEIERELAERAE